MFHLTIALTLVIAVANCLPNNSLESHLRFSNPDHGKIVGGYEVKPNAIPHQISFQSISGSHFCGGSILNEDSILTAGHCCEAVSASRVRIVAGEHDLNKASGDEQVRYISEMIVHEQFATAGTNNDVCILKLKDKLSLNDKVKGVPLPKSEQKFNDDATASGWGTTEEGGYLSSVLLAVDVKIVSEEDCKKAYPFSIDESMICAAAPGKDSCQGDSGGPMTCDEEKLHCGVVSWGRGCAQTGYPGVYAKTAHFIDWINNLV